MFVSETEKDTQTQALLGPGPTDARLLPSFSSQGTGSAHQPFITSIYLAATTVK